MHAWIHLTSKLIFVHLQHQPVTSSQSVTHHSHHYYRARWIIPLPCHATQRQLFHTDRSDTVSLKNTRLWNNKQICIQFHLIQWHGGGLDMYFQSHVAIFIKNQALIINPQSSDYLNQDILLSKIPWILFPLQNILINYSHFNTKAVWGFVIIMRMWRMYGQRRAGLLWIIVTVIFTQSVY